MSCHNVGRALNSVVVVIMDMYDKKEINLEAAKKLLVAARKGVYWCDGNSYEATTHLEETGRCGRCLRMINNDGEKLYSVWEVSNNVKNRYNILDGSATDIVYQCLCPECFDIVMENHTGDKYSGEKEREYIDKNR